VDFPYMLTMIPNSFMSRANTLVVPGGKMSHAMEIILTPIMHDMIENKMKAYTGVERRQTKANP
jgi:phosphoribulokinase